MYELHLPTLHTRLLPVKLAGGSRCFVEKRDGSLIAISLSAAPIRDDNRKVKGIIGFLTDITERKRSEEALKQAEEKYRDDF